MDKNKNASAVVSPTSKGKPMHGLNSNAMVSPSKAFGGPVSKEVSNMVNTLSEMPSGKLPAMSK